VSDTGRRWCPECGREFERAIVACPDCRAILADEPPSQAGEPAVVHRVPDAAAGALLCGMLEQNGVPAVLRSGSIPGYPAVARDWSTTAWGEILVRDDQIDEARALIADYLSALERGGLVRDEDVEGEPPR
jgi:hypothetical protein